MNVLQIGFLEQKQSTDTKAISCRNLPPHIELIEGNCIRTIFYLSSKRFISLNHKLKFRNCKVCQDRDNT